MAAIKQPRLLFGSLGRIHISRYGFHGHCKAVLYTIYAARLCVRADGITAAASSSHCVPRQMKVNLNWSVDKLWL